LTSCFALSIVEERERQRAFLALRAEEGILAEVADGGFNFGHALFGTTTFGVIHFAYEFYSFQTYHVLINLNSPLVQAVPQGIGILNAILAAADAPARASHARIQIGWSR
jgi:hypothetical protein